MVGYAVICAVICRVICALPPINKALALTCWLDYLNKFEFELNFLNLDLQIGLCIKIAGINI